MAKKLGQRWVSVEVSKPSPFLRVLVLFEPGGHFRDRVHVGYYWGDEGEYAGTWGPSCCRKFKITHWAPIGELPT